MGWKQETLVIQHFSVRQKMKFLKFSELDTYIDFYSFHWAAASAVGGEQFSTFSKLVMLIIIVFGGMTLRLVTPWMKC